jgi:hypothetical protein
MEPENSLQCSQEPTTFPYPEPNEFKPQPQILFPKYPFQYYQPLYA